MRHFSLNNNDEWVETPVDEVEVEPEPEELDISEALELANQKEVEIFLQLTPDWHPRAGDSQTLLDRATEIAGSATFFISDLQIALRELRQQDPGFGHYKPEPEAEPVVQKVDSRGIVEVPAHANTGTLTVDPNVRAELNRLSLSELARRAARDRHAHLTDQRRKQIRSDEV